MSCRLRLASSPVPLKKRKYERSVPCILKCEGRSLKFFFRFKWVEGKDNWHQAPGGAGRVAASVKERVDLNHIDLVTPELIGPF